MVGLAQTKGPTGAPARFTRRSGTTFERRLAHEGSDGIRYQPPRGPGADVGDVSVEPMRAPPATPVRRSRILEQVPRVGQRHSRFETQFGKERGKRVARRSKRAERGASARGHGGDPAGVTTRDASDDDAQLWKSYVATPE